MDLTNFRQDGSLGTLGSRSYILFQIQLCSLKKYFIELKLRGTLDRDVVGCLSRNVIFGNRVQVFFGANGAAKNSQLQCLPLTYVWF